MDIIAVQEAKKIKKLIGDLNKLQTEYKQDVVGAINEIKKEGTILDCIEVIQENVQMGEVRAFWIDFVSSCYIKGIKVTGNELTGTFNFALYTKPLSEGGTYVYYSGDCVNVIWDIMEIPFKDESGERKVYAILENKGAPSNFKIQIFYQK
ncbi:MAG: hypothetical protein QXI16_01505 [Sulfolobaceae archaeon]